VLDAAFVFVVAFNAYLQLSLAYNKILSVVESPPATIISVLSLHYSLISSKSSSVNGVLKDFL